MNIHQCSRIARVCVVSLAVYGASGSVFAQDAMDRSGTQSSSMSDRTSDRDYGWLGLLGLAGLAGFMRKKDRDDSMSRTSTR